MTAPSARDAPSPAGSLLAGWLGDTPPAAFVARSLSREPVARPARAADAIHRFGWDTLDRLLAIPALDVLVVRGGREQPVPRPGSLTALRSLLDAGIGVVVRRAERHDAGLAELAGALARDVPGIVHVQLFVTAAETNGFGWHYDAEEVFIVQTVGEKVYYLRRNTVDPEPVPGAQPDFARVREERTPIATCTLAPGDWLHVPRGWWHVAKARTDSLSISLGVTRTGVGAPANR